MSDYSTSATTGSRNAATEDRESSASSASSARTSAVGAASGARSSCGASRRLISRKTLALRSGAMRWRQAKHLSGGSSRASRRLDLSSGATGSSQTCEAASNASNQAVCSTSDETDTRPLNSNNVTPTFTKDDMTPDTNASADSNAEVEQKNGESDSTDTDEAEGEAAVTSIASPEMVEEDGSGGTVFANLDGSSQTHVKSGAETAAPKGEMANVIEKAISDFCNSRTVETMRRMFAGVTSEMEALQFEGGRQGDKSVQAPHPVTGELVKEGIVIGTMDVFAPRVFREYRLEMKDSLVEGFLTDAGIFRSICYRTKCQLEVTRRLLNRKMCLGGRWVKYLIVRIVGPSQRSITCCDQLLQKAVPSFKYRIEYPRAAFCRMFFREDIPDNALLYFGYQRTGGTSNRYGTLRLDTPYRITTDRTIGNCPWKSGALKIGKLSLSGSGAHLSMRQVYPGYGYTYSSPIEPQSKGAEAVDRIEQMHSQFISKRQLLLQDRRAMTIPVCR